MLVHAESMTFLFRAGTPCCFRVDWKLRPTVLVAGLRDKLNQNRWSLDLMCLFHMSRGIHLLHFLATWTFVLTEDYNHYASTKSPWVLGGRDCTEAFQWVSWRATDGCQQAVEGVQTGPPPSGPPPCNVATSISCMRTPLSVLFYIPGVCQPTVVAVFFIPSFWLHGVYSFHSQSHRLKSKTLILLCFRLFIK